MTVRRKSESTSPVAHKADKRLRTEKRRRLAEEPRDPAASEPRRQAAQQSPKAGVENSERRFRATFDLVPVGITHIDPEGRILQAVMPGCGSDRFPRYV